MHISALGVYGDTDDDDDDDDDDDEDDEDEDDEDDDEDDEAAVEAAEVPPEELRLNAGTVLPPLPPRPGDLPAAAAVVAAPLGVCVVAGGGMADPRRGEGWRGAGRWTSSHAVPSTLGA